MRGTYDSEVDYISGETVVGGSYSCCECGEDLEIPEGKVTNLPICPRCHHQHWRGDD